MAENERNYAAEAVRILSGQTTLLPEREHLAALAQRAETELQQSKLLLGLLGATLTRGVGTGDRPGEYVIEQADVDEIHTGGYVITFRCEDTPHGPAWIVALQKRVLAKTPASVN